MERITMHGLTVAARTIYGEARGESPEGQLAVAYVIWNRVNGKRWFGNSLEAVCLKRWQFSVWNEGDPNREVIESRTTNWLITRGYFDMVLDAAVNDVGDPTHGSLHYLNPDAVTRMPTWAKGKIPAVIIGAHHFYNDIG